MTGSTARDIVNQATKNAGRDRLARIAAAVLALSLIVAGVYFGPRVVDQGTRIGELETSARDSNAAATKLAEQVRQLGGTPVVQPPAPVTSTASVDPETVRSAARTAVAEYCAAPTHPCRGSDGSAPPFDLIVDAVVAKIPVPQDGRDGRDAPAPDYAALVAAYCGQDGEPCRGLTGEKGEKGDPPTCVSEPSQCRGVDGQPPAGWTTTYPDGSTGSCTRAPEFDPAAPRYSCTRSAPPSTDPPLPLGG